MEPKENVINSIIANKMIVIIRGVSGDDLIRTVEAVYRGGVRLVEVTFDQSGKIPDSETAANIAALCREFAGRVRIGAGTVMTTEQVRLAREAGAEFIISPDSFEDVIRETVRLGMVSIPGAMTPTEAAMAHRWGADFVKLFPNSEFSPSYLKALCAPLSHIRFLAVGGINERNLKDYMAAGAWGIGVSSGIIDKKAIRDGDWDKLERLARAYTEQL